MSICWNVRQIRASVVASVSANSAVKSLTKSIRGGAFIAAPSEKGNGPPLHPLGNPGGSPGRARSALNNATLYGLQKAFDKYGEKACMDVARKKPDIFLKLLVLLVPREMEVTHKDGVKAMSDEQLEQGIEAIRLMLANRDAGGEAKVIDAVTEPAALPAQWHEPRRKRGAEAKPAPSP
jgi:hypothetical protein